MWPLLERFEPVCLRKLIGRAQLPHNRNIIVQVWCWGRGGDIRTGRSGGEWRKPFSIHIFGRRRRQNISKKQNWKKAKSTFVHTQRIKNVLTRRSRRHFRLIERRLEKNQVLKTQEALAVDEFLPILGKQRARCAHDKDNMSTVGAQRDQMLAIKYDITIVMVAYVFFLFIRGVYPIRKS